MAHKILGIDLGSHSVKVALLEAGFRQTQLLGFFERPLEPLQEGEEELGRRVRTLGLLLDGERIKAETFAAAMSEATLRLVTLPLNDPKKIEQVIGYELESEILGEVDDLTLDQVICKSTATSTNVIAVAAERQKLRVLVAALATVNAEPRLIGAAPLAYAALRPHAFAEQPAVAIIDLGHETTQVCVMHEDALSFARSIGRGSADLTRGVAETYRLDPVQAERVKHEQAFVAPPAIALDPAQRRMDGCVRDALRPLMRELRQTLAAQRVSGTPPTHLMLTGGGARLRGLPAHFELELGIPVEPLKLVPESTLLLRPLLPEASSELNAQALGLALAEAGPVPQVNLRKGELAYRSDYSFLRGKARFLGVATLCILACAGLNAAAALRGLRKEADALEAQLKRETTELFGQPMLDGKAVSDELKGGPKGGAPAIPSITAFDVLDEISSHVPAGDKIKLDVLKLDIKPKKIYLDATAESAQQVDDLVAALGKVECFQEVQKGKLSTERAPPSGEGGKDKLVELKRFNLTINSTCP